MSQREEISAREGTRPGRGRKLCLACALSLLSIAAFAPPALAADSIYWASYAGFNSVVAVTNADGSGGARDLFTYAEPRGAQVLNAAGLTIDPIAEQIYWANQSTIGRGSFSGCAASDTCGSILYNSAPLPLSGTAIDPAQGWIYWTNGDSEIIRARLDGSGGNSLVNTAGATPIGGGGTGGLVIDRGANRLYWTNDTFGIGTISWANLDGSGGADIPVGAATVDRPWGLGIDSGSGTIYWASYQGAASNKGTISWAKLDGSAAGDLYTSATPGCSILDGPNGIVVDSAANKIYWANFNSSTISRANLDGSGGCTNLDTSGATNEGQDEIVALKAPSAAGIPAISGTAVTGQALSCSQGQWAQDLPQSGLFQAPKNIAFTWSRDGAAIAGATAATYTPTSEGSYRCVVTAANAAGSTSQTSNPLTVSSARLDVTGFHSSKRCFTPSATSIPLSTRSSRGTRLVFKSSGAGTARIRILRRKGKRAADRNCPKLTNVKSRHPGRYVRELTLKRSAVAGRNSIFFSGTVAHRVLPAGRYRATIVVSDSHGGKSKTRSCRFTIK